jgi:hypothetical protein
MLNPTGGILNGSGGLVASRDADADADFAKALIGLVVNARLSAESISSADQRRLRTFAANDAAAENDQLWLGVRSQVAALDTTLAAASRGVPVESRVLGTAEITGEALHVLAGIYGMDISSTTERILHCDNVANITAGRAPSSVRAPWTLALEVKRDADGTLLIPTEMNRTVSGSAVNPAAAVIATLDCRGLTNKTFTVTDTAVGTYTLEASHDGVTYRAPAVFAGIATIVGSAVPTDLMMQWMKGYRYLRIRATEAAGTVTVEISAQGA